MISLEGVSKVFRGERGGEVRAVDDVSFEVPRGETLVLLGASGCGKTTTLKMINRLVEPSAGTLRVDGRDVSQTSPDALRRGIGYVIQGVGLFPHKSVAANVGAVPRLLGWHPDRIAARVDALLERVDLAPQVFRERRPSELSGGEQQRVGVARALAAESSVLLMDEPFGAVDPVTRDGLQQQLIAIRRELSLTIVLVTHDVNEALLLADRIAVMDAGCVIQLGTPEELFAAPSDARVSELLEMPLRHADRIEALAHARDRSAADPAAS